ncbi:MAG TPA: hypothetical protein VKH40_12160 [Alloacidobacterium sp.]|nr:hypothetical protein [Alloacidobacterium sp.]
MSTTRSFWALNNTQLLVSFEIAFAPEPVFHRYPQLFEGHAIPRLQQAVSHGQRIVENGIVGEVAHGEVVDPCDGTWTRFSGGIDALDL